MMALILLGGCVSKPPENGVFYTCGNWDIPPAYHGNPWAPGGVGIAGPYVYEPLFIYLPENEKFISRLGELIFESDDRLTLKVKLKKGVKWHDGYKFSSCDVQTTFYIGYLKNFGIWNNLADITCPDDDTIVFKWKRVSPTDKVRALTEPITSAHHIFGQWSDMVPDLIRKKKMIPLKDKNAIMERFKEEQKVREVLFRYQPKMPIGTGPFKVTRVSSSDILLDFFPEYYEAGNVKIKKVRIQRWGSNEVVWSYLISGQVDGVAPSCPYDLAREIIKRNPGIRIITPSDMTDFGLIFNCSKEPTSDINFRKALAYLIDRDSVRKVAYYYGDTVDDYSLGFPKSFRDKWLNKDFYKGLSRYNLDPQKAVKILTDAGYTKDTDTGKWHTPSGGKIELTIIAPAGLNDLVLIAESSAVQLSKFGIPCDVRVVPGEIFYVMLRDQKFDLAAENGSQLGKYGHPSISLDRYFAKGSVIQTASGLLENLPGRNGKKVNTASLALKLGQTLNPPLRNEITMELAWVTNEYLPYLPCYEKRLMIFIQDKKRVTGWPSDNDPLWKGAPGGIENIFCTMIVKGILKPAQEELVIYGI